MTTTSLALVPAPRFVSHLPGRVRLGPDTRVIAPHDPELAPVARRLRERLAERLGSDTSESTATDDRSTGIDVQLTLDAGPPATDTQPRDPNAGVDESYSVTVDHHGIVLLGATPEGLRHATTTLLTAIEVAPRPLGHRPGTVFLPAMQVADAPRFCWRGLHLDLARHFLPVDAVHTILEVMADLRLNRLHLHLANDQGRRPGLASPPTQHPDAHTTISGPGGYYTATDLAHIEQIANDLGITVVPEIGVPGIGIPETVPFLPDLLSETAALTSGPWLHLGGNEAPTPHNAEYARLFGTALDTVNAAGKIAIGWQEIAQLDLPAGTIVQFWDERATAPATAADVVDAARRGAHVLLSAASRTDLDSMPEATTIPGPEQPPHLSVRDAYEWDPDAVLPDLPPRSLIGVEARVRTGTARTPDDVMRLLLPRLAAVAEVAWSPQRARSWPDFAPRLARFSQRWTDADLAWTSTPDVQWAHIDG